MVAGTIDGTSFGPRFDPTAICRAVTVGLTRGKGPTPRYGHVRTYEIREVSPGLVSDSGEIFHIIIV